LPMTRQVAPRVRHKSPLVFERNGDRDRAVADLRRALELEKNEVFAIEAREALVKIEAANNGQDH
jgi:hypothetical protein